MTKIDIYFRFSREKRNETKRNKTKWYLLLDLTLTECFARKRVMEDISVKIAVDGGDDWWEMRYEIKTSYGSFKFNDSFCERMNLGQWRDFIEGRNPGPHFDDPVTRSGKNFIFSAGDIANIEIDEIFLIGPLTMAIDEAICDGWFGEEAQALADGPCIKGDKNE